MSYEDLECPKCGTLARITRREGVQVQCCDTKGCEGNWPWRTVDEWSDFRQENYSLVDMHDLIDKMHEHNIGFDPAKPGSDETVYNWPTMDRESVFTKEMLTTADEFKQQHMCDFRDSLWDDILKLSAVTVSEQRPLSYFAVGHWMMNHMKDISRIDRNVLMNTLVGLPLREDDRMPRDELWGMDVFHNILFKIKVGR